MSRRRRRSASRQILTVGLVVLGALVVVDVLRALGWLLAVAALAGGGYWLGRRARPAVRAGASALQLGRVTAERDQLEAEAADLRRQLAEAQDAAHAAWDAAASVRPRVAGDDAAPAPAIDELLADPRSGVHRLGNP